MSDILEQINSLTEQFSNLFEVEGLGDPASDVPPSTNKIKKDRKTKDGKVELVSVEDELFPYDGNKREQYRQKIIDTINGMIQGTATLEDLLQIVRQKKAPLKEGFEGAIEILENLREQIDKKVKAGEINLDKALKLDKKIEDKMSSEKNAQEYYEELDKRDKKERLGDKAVAKSIRRNERKNANEGFEGAIEVLEDIHTAIEKGAHEIKRPILHAKAIMNYSNELQKAAKKELPKDKKKSIKAINNKMNEIAKKRGISPVDNYVDGNKTDESFGSAIEILEEIINEVSLKKWKEAAKNSYDKRREIADKSAEADKKSWDNYEKQSKLSPEDEPELFKKAVDQGAIAYKDKKRADHAMGVYANTPDSKHSATKYNKAILNSLKGREDKYVETGKKSDLDRAINAFHLAKLNPVKEGFDGAIEILEEVINEVSERTKIDAYKKRATQHQELADRETKIANDYAKLGAYEPAINHLKKASDSQKKEFKHRLNTISHDKKFGQDAFNKAQKELYDEWKAKNSIKEAQELSELFDRPDLLDDISMALTNKTIKQHLENQAKKLLGGKKKIKKENKCNQ